MTGDDARRSYREWAVCIDQVVAACICIGVGLLAVSLHLWIASAALFTSGAGLYAISVRAAGMAASREVRGAAQAWLNPIAFAWRLLRLEPKGSKVWKGLAAVSSLVAGLAIVFQRHRLTIQDDGSALADYTQLREIPSDVHKDVVWTPLATTAKPTPDAGPGPGPANVDAIDLRPILTNGAVFNLTGVEGEAPKRVYLRKLQPMVDTGPGGGGSCQIRYLTLIAPRGGRAILGGLPAEAPPGVNMAPILIEDSILDAAIELGPNVQIGRNVTLVRVTHLGSPK